MTDRREFLVGAIIATSAAIGRSFDAAADTAGEDAATAQHWVAVLRVMFPHARVPESSYLPTANALVAAADKDPNTRVLLQQGWRDLTRARPWQSATSEQQIAAVAALQGTPVFALLRQTMVFTFYADPAVWVRFGYEGDAWRFGGYQGRVNTLDWLPPVPEADGPSS